MNFWKLQLYLQWKKFSIVCSESPKQQSAWKKLSSHPPLTDWKDFCFWNKNFWTEIHSNIQISAFQVLCLWECMPTVLGCRQMFFLTPTRDMFLPVAACDRSVFFMMLSHLRFIKWVRFFEQKSIVKWEIFFASFSWLWDFLTENLKLVDKLQM